ncbi:MAG: GNAT family N-acetyltransferase [Mucinivorans sp.]
MKEITFLRVTSPSAPNYQAAQALYHAAFPVHERRSEEAHRATLTDDAFFAYTIYIGGQFAGILYFWRWANYSYLEHLATVPELRGQNIGGQALEQWKNNENGRTLMLEIEPPLDEITHRREGFYLRHAMQINTHKHLHPSYSPLTVTHELRVMSFPQLLTDEQFVDFRNYLLNHILGAAEN